MIPQVSQFFLPNRWSNDPALQPFQGEQIPGAWAPNMQQQPNSGGLLMPKCHSSELLLLMVERHTRADAALAPWAEDAKRCIEFLEGKQWSAAEIKDAEADDRPLLTLNKIAPLVRLVLGYHRNSRVDTRYMPSHDTNSVEAMAQVITKVLKQISSNSDEAYVDTEVFLDGIGTGRGYYDWRLSFERNDFGEMYVRAKDNFTIRPDPDADTYDPSDPFQLGWGYVFEDRWTNIDEITFHYGANVSSLIEPLIRSSGYRGGIPSDMLSAMDEITPWRNFGGNQDANWSYQSYIANSVDPYRKNVRLIECQHKIRVMQQHIVDLETGDRVPIPTHFGSDQVMKIMQWCAEQYAARGQSCPMRVQWRPTLRVRWTTMVGDIIVHDDWSPYRTFTQVPYFPYWRRGKTRGMIDDLIDPQRELNKRRSSQIDILTRVAHSGWTWHKDSLEESEKEKLEAHGGAAGLNLEWKGSPDGKPQRIEPGQMPSAIKDLERSATLDLKEIAGINDSALGQVDRVQSGRAIEGRQKQSILGLEPYFDNMRRTKFLVGRKKLELLQTHYTEPRLFKLEGPSGQYSYLGINLAGVNGDIVNNVTTGRYDIVVDESPLSASMLNAQFEELMSLVEKGILPIPMVMDVLLDLSAAPQKELLKQRVNAYLKAQGMLTADEMMMAQSSGILLPAGKIPPPQPFGAPKGGSGGGQQPPDGGGGGSGVMAGPSNLQGQNSAAQTGAPQAA